MRCLAENGKGVLLTSHYLREVEELCTYIYVIDHGRLIAQGSPGQLKALTNQERAVRILLPILPAAVENELKVLVRETGARLIQERQEESIMIIVIHREDLSGRVAATVALNGGSMLKLEVIEPSLEDAVLALVGQAQKRELSHAAE